MFFFQFFHTLEYSPTPLKLLGHYIWLVSKISQNWLTWRHLTSDNGCQNSGEHYKIRHFHRPDFPKSHNSVSKPHHVKKSFYYGFWWEYSNSKVHFCSALSYRRNWRSEVWRDYAMEAKRWRRNSRQTSKDWKRWSSAWAHEQSEYFLAGNLSPDQISLLPIIAYVLWCISGFQLICCNEPWHVHAPG